MFRSNKPTIADFRADYAADVDFCDLFTNDTKHLYLLTFLLIANHQESVQCFASTVDEAFQEPAVFKQWARSWVKRRLIENAIEMVAPVSARNGQKRDLWSPGQCETKECEIDMVTKLAAFDRFVFVMSILERYSDWDCALLLGCGMSKVARTRMRALRRLPALAALLPGGDRLGVGGMEVTRNHRPSNPRRSVATSNIKSLKNPNSMGFTLLG